MRVLLAFALSLTSLSSFAEGRCPPGQYPIGDDRAPGCAPIPTAGGGAASSPVPTGKWEERWGAIAEDVSANAREVAGATGVSESRVSKQDAIAVAMEQYKKSGAKSVKSALFTIINAWPWRIRLIRKAVCRGNLLPSGHRMWSSQSPKPWKSAWSVTGRLEAGVILFTLHAVCPNSNHSSNGFCS